MIKKLILFKDRVREGGEIVGESGEKEEEGQ
jgi:hypothetical protein